MQLKSKGGVVTGWQTWRMNIAGWPNAAGNALKKPPCRLSGEHLNNRHFIGKSSPRDSVNGYPFQTTLD
jgi:hypothetical protein